MNTQDNNEYQYFKNVNTGSLYRTKEITFNTGEKGTELNRYNWDFENWRGHIHNHEQTRKDISTLSNGMIETTFEDIKSLIN